MTPTSHPKRDQGQSTAEMTRYKLLTLQAKVPYGGTYRRPTVFMEDDQTYEVKSIRGQRLPPQHTASLIPKHKIKEDLW